MHVRMICAGLIGFALGMTNSVEIASPVSNFPLTVSFGVEQASAIFGVRRREARRIRRESIAGCSPYNAYYNCSGVYYEAVIEDGTTYYVVINP